MSSARGGPNLRKRSTLATPRGLRRDLSELLAHDLRRLDDDAALLHALVHGPRFEAAVRMRPEAIGRDEAQSLADPLGGLGDGLGLVRVHVDDSYRELLGERLALEEVEPAVAVVRHREVELVDRQLQDARVDRGEVAV